MEKPELQIVTFGKYKNKPVAELLADNNYVDWLKKQIWFTDKPIYNIVVNQTISTINNSKISEHNKLQKLLLDQNNQQKQISILCNKKLRLYFVKK